MSKFTNRLTAQLCGEESGIVIYWDAQDSANAGPAYRDESDLSNGSGALDFGGWGRVGGGIGDHDCQGYSVSDYFGDNGQYRGPDEFGVYPVLMAS